MTNSTQPRDIFDCYACDTRNVVSPIDHELTWHDGAQTVWLRGADRDEVAERNALADLGA